MVVLPAFVIAAVLWLPAGVSVSVNVQGLLDTPVGGRLECGLVKAVELKDLFDIITETHGLKITVDETAFRDSGDPNTEDVLRVKMSGTTPKGLTVGQFLDEMMKEVNGTYTVNSAGITVTPKAKK